MDLFETLNAIAPSQALPFFYLLLALVTSVRSAEDVGVAPERVAAAEDGALT